MLLTSDQEAIRDAVRDFCQAELWPNAARWDREHHFPADAHRGLRPCCARNPTPAPCGPFHLHPWGPAPQRLLPLHPGPLRPATRTAPTPAPCGPFHPSIPEVLHLLGPCTPKVPPPLIP